MSGLPGVADANPFSSRFVRPGAIAYAFGPNEAADPLGELSLRILFCPRRRAAIVGPHGTGKSTLLADLRRRWRLDGLVVAEADAGPGRRPRDLRRDLWLCRRADVLTVDSFERLDLRGRLLVLLAQRRAGCAVAVTSHRGVRGYESVHRTRRTLDVEAAVLAELLRDRPGECETLLHSPQWAESRRRRGENLRESLFDAYDWIRERSE